MTTIRIIDDWLEFEGRRVARLVAGLPPTLLYRLEEAFDAIDADVDEAELDEEIERLIRAMTEGGRPPSLAARMARARMRIVSADADLASPSSPGERS